MTLAEQEIYNRIKAFRFDDADASLPFVSRLERDNGWSRAYAVRAITEYRKFVFLAMVAGHPVSPSDQVDQAWHLHLLYTRSYWERFCRDVLGAPVHHGPTKGGRDETLKFEAWYDRTLESYRRFFGEPPGDIWPDVSIRFGEDLHYVRVNTRRSWIIPKRRLDLARSPAAATVLLLLLAIGGSLSIDLLGQQVWGWSMLAASGAIVVAYLAGRR